MSDFTKGPWSVGYDGIGGCYFIPELESAGSPHGLSVSSEADARLIASAPDLLAALKRLWLETELSGNAYAGDFGWPEVREAVKAAIAKAEGR